ncbi:Fur family transcriptional regulator [Kineothrix sp. MB12-C1]|uniref:Fur family transcriptional regulator n=1 Tax=Kineothrix sp. MB12-C1 TaxID=3070215 RepID=UPI0027D327E8|nr:transcriptional repressor [Kineothrix sp. MB12-C1]WMC94366.1 transcriptional repressor [Kineothrix sp. MB12-C1]
MKEHGEPVFPCEIKKTKQREEIFKILSEETMPISAVDIYHRLMQTNEKANYAISTVYRALGAFEEKGYVTKSTLITGDMAYYEWNYGAHRHYAICLQCHKLIPLKQCPFEHAKIETGSDNFTITGHKLELYGYCKECK